MAEQFMDSLASNNPDYRLVVQQLDTAAQRQGLAGTYITINSFLVPERYMLQMYRQERNGTRETQTEVLSSAIEKGLALPLVPKLDKSGSRVQVKYPQRGERDDSLLFLSDTILNYTQVWTYMYATLHY